MSENLRVRRRDNKERKREGGREKGRESESEREVSIRNIESQKAMPSTNATNASDMPPYFRFRPTSQSGPS